MSFKEEFGDSSHSVLEKILVSYANKKTMSGEQKSRFIATTVTGVSSE